MNQQVVTYEVRNHFNLCGSSWNDVSSYHWSVDYVRGELMSEKCFVGHYSAHDLQSNLNAMVDQGYLIREIFFVGEWQGVSQFTVIAEKVTYER